MNAKTNPAILHPEDMLYYTGTPVLPEEKKDLLSAEKRRRGGKVARKVISGVKTYLGGNRKQVCYRAYVAKSGKNARTSHGAFTYDCQSKEEAAYIASMAHRLLKPWFATLCKEGTPRIRPAKFGDPHFFWNDIWGLWRYTRISTPGGLIFAGALLGGGSRSVFITDATENIYRALIRAPFFNRRTVNRFRNDEPVQPMVTKDRETGKIRVTWIGLSEIVMGKKVEIPPRRLSHFDFRKDALENDDVPLPYPGPPRYPAGWTPLAGPEWFDAVHALNHDWGVHHQYGYILKPR